MKITVSKDKNNMLCGGRHYVFVPHEKPRCPFCAFHDPGRRINCMWMSFCSRQRGRSDSVVGYWKETQ